MYDFYKNQRAKDGTVENLPFVFIPQSQQDKFEEYVEGATRLDIISNKYYGDPTLAPFILCANPDIMDEHSIPDGYILRIPFPLDRIKNIWDSQTKL